MEEAVAELDKQKEKIAFFRSLFFFLLASIFALVAFVFTKYRELSFVQLLLAISPDLRFWWRSWWWLQS
jgi:uncharacterized membrane protein AbrB (regulator of aidB expression)